MYVVNKKILTHLKVLLPLICVSRGTDLYLNQRRAICYPRGLVLTKKSYKNLNIGRRKFIYLLADAQWSHYGRRTQTEVSYDVPFQSYCQKTCFRHPRAAATSRKHKLGGRYPPQSHLPPKIMFSGHVGTQCVL